MQIEPSIYSMSSTSHESSSAPPYHVAVAQNISGRRRGQFFVISRNESGHMHLTDFCSRISSHDTSQHPGYSVGSAVTHKVLTNTVFGAGQAVGWSLISCEFLSGLDIAATNGSPTLRAAILSDFPQRYLPHLRRYVCSIDEINR